MKHYIDKFALVAEIDKRIMDAPINHIGHQRVFAYNDVKDILNTLELKEAIELVSTAYVVTRCEEHSDYVESVFFDENKAQAYCDQFKGNGNEYARHITKVEVTL